MLSSRARPQNIDLERTQNAFGRANIIKKDFFLYIWPTSCQRAPKHQEEYVLRLLATAKTSLSSGQPVTLPRNWCEIFHTAVKDQVSGLLASVFLITSDRPQSFMPCVKVMSYNC